jgi:hypothetical protein
MPSLPEVAWVGVRVCPVAEEGTDTKLNDTLRPDTGFPGASRTRTEIGRVRVELGGACWLFPPSILILVAVTVKVVKVSEAPGSVQISKLSPAAGLPSTRVTPVTVANTSLPTASVLPEAPAGTVTWAEREEPLPLVPLTRTV